MSIHLTNTAKALCLLLPFFLSFDALSNEYQLDLATSYQYFYYQEYSLVGDTLNTESGNLTGAVFKFKKSLTSFHQVAINYKYLSGLVDYDGYTQSLSNHKTKTQEAITEKEITYLYCGLSDRYSIGFSAGDASWSRKIQPANGVLGLNEKYKWKKISINQSYQYLNLTLIGSMSHLFNSSVEVDLTEINRGVVKVDMPYGSQVDTEINYMHPISKSLGVTLSALFQWRYFERSKPTSSILEPENELMSVGFNLGFRYIF